MKTLAQTTLILLLALNLVGCDSNSEEEPSPLQAILGFWKQVENDPDVDLFVRINEETVVVAATSTLIDTVACSALQVNAYNPETGVMDVTESDGTMSTSSVMLNGSNLIVDGDTYERTDSFPTCTVSLQVGSLEEALHELQVAVDKG